jgi:hypothetical protein
LVTTAGRLFREKYTQYGAKNVRYAREIAGRFHHNVCNETNGLKVTAARIATAGLPDLDGRPY